MRAGACLRSSCGVSHVAKTAGFSSRFDPTKENIMSLGTLFLIVLILLLIGVLPTWPHSSKWGYGPSGGVGLVVIILIILVVMGRI